jgi:mycothiol synthase
MSRSRSTNWRVRGYSEADLPAIVGLINLCDRADGLEGSATLDDLQQHFATPGLNPERQVLVAEDSGASSGGTLLGFGRAFPGGGKSGERVYGLMLRVHPEARSHGLEGQIARRLIEIVRIHEAEDGEEPPARVRLRTYLFKQHSSVRAVVEELGFRAVREGWTMSRPLDGEMDEPKPTGGVSIRHYRVPDDNRDALNALNESFADYFDTQPLSEERWSHEMAAPYARSDLSWLAVDESRGRVVGLSVCWVNAEANRQSGKSDGWIEGIGVIPEWRRRGVARSLLLCSLYSLREAGITAANVDVDAGSPAALGLFTSCGFAPHNVLLQYECDLEDVRLAG